MNRLYRSAITFAILFILLLIYLQSGLHDEVSAQNLRELGNNPYAPALIVLAMTAAWLFAFPASIFFFVTPLLYSPVEATAIICIGSLTGTSAGYWAARFVGSPWFEKFREHRITVFLKRHSSFASLFAIRIFPSSPHGFINYGAGLLEIPLIKFLIATILAVGIKAFLYATAINGSVGAKSIKDALNWQTVGALFAIGLLALIGHVIKRKWTLRDASVSEP